MKIEPKKTQRMIDLEESKKAVELELSAQRIKQEKNIAKEGKLYPINRGQHSIEQAQAKMDKIAQKEGYAKHSMVDVDGSNYYFKLYDKLPAKEPKKGGQNG